MADNLLSKMFPRFCLVRIKASGTLAKVWGVKVPLVKLYFKDSGKTEWHRPEELERVPHS